MDLKSGLSVASMFGDFRNFRQLYLAFSENGKQAFVTCDSKDQLIEALNSDDFTFLGQ